MVRMIDCIREQGMVLAGAVEGWKELCAPFQDAFGEGISSVDLIGSGRRGECPRPVSDGRDRSRTDAGSAVFSGIGFRGDDF